ncbi:MAG: OB-fold nucleic acid binding domain-containing protein, partial [Gammaproteobacteria bacterium]|nr:OB-fold nucleic acid binding domain-containing protein [Gammaproteobacteria bacterium]
YSLGGADLLRRAMGKKKPEEMAKQRAIFMEGAKQLDFDPDKAGALFDLMEKFAGYGFNKSHSAAYALVSYQTMWLKAHYPAAFMAAVLSADMDNTDKVVTLVDECREMKLEVVPPAINLCQYKFTVKDDNTVLYGLGAIKGVGEGAIQNMVEEREANGPYKDLFDFCNRVDLKKVNRRVLEALIRGGALDEVGPNRATLMANLGKALKMAEQANKNSVTGQEDMFGMMAPVAESASEIGAYELEPEWDEGSLLLQEKETLGLYLTGHPIDRHLDELANFTSMRLSAFGTMTPERKQTVVVAGLIVSMSIKNTRRGDKLGIITLDDRSGRQEATVFGEEFERYRDQLAKDKLIVVEGEVSPPYEEGGAIRLRAQTIYDLEQARNQFAKALVLRVDEQQAGNGFIPALGEILEPYREGNCPIVVEYVRADARARLCFADEWRVSPNETLLNRLRHLGGEDRVRLHYG